MSEARGAHEERVRLLAGRASRGEPLFRPGDPPPPRAPARHGGPRRVSARAAPEDDGSPWGENAVRELEDAAASGD